MTTKAETQYKKIIEVLGLEDAVQKLKRYANTDAFQLPHCEMDVKFVGEGYQGKRVTSFEEPSFVVTQHGHVPSTQRRFGDFARDFYCSNRHNGKYPNSRDMQMKLKDEFPQRISLDVYTEREPWTKDEEPRLVHSKTIFYFGLGKRDPRIVISLFNENQLPHRFSYYEKSWRWGKPERQGDGDIKAYRSPMGDPPQVGDSLCTELRQICSKFQATDTAIDIKVGDKLVPLQYNGEIILEDLVWYLGMKNSAEPLQIVQETLPLLSKAKKETRTMVETVSTKGVDKGEGPILLTLDDGRELQLDIFDETYEFLKWDASATLESVQHFLNGANKKYEPLLADISKASQNR